MRESAAGEIPDDAAERNPCADDAEDGEEMPSERRKLADDFIDEPVHSPILFLRESVFSTVLSRYNRNARFPAHSFAFMHSFANDEGSSPSDR